MEEVTKNKSSKNYDLTLYFISDGKSIKKKKFTIPQNSQHDLRFIHTGELFDRVKVYHAKTLVYERKAQLEILEDGTVPFISNDQDFTLKRNVKIKSVTQSGSSAVQENFLHLYMPERHLPEHPAAYSGIRAVLLQSPVQALSLSPKQITALADYIFCGGLVIVGDKCKNLIDKLIANAPLKSTGAWVDKNGLRRLQLGRGFICELTGKWSLANKNKIAAEIDSHYTKRFIPYFSSVFGRHKWPKESMQSIFVLLALFGLYALFSGPFILFFIKAKRPIVKRYIFIVISVFSVLAILGGALIRTRRGVVHWATITYLSNDGGIQYGHMTVSSAGSEKMTLKFKNPNTKFWLIKKRSNRNYYGGYEYSQMAFDLDSESIPSLSLSPFGHRELYLKSYDNTMKALQFTRVGNQIHIQNKSSYVLSNLTIHSMNYDFKNKTRMLGTKVISRLFQKGASTKITMPVRSTTTGYYAPSLISQNGYYYSEDFGMANANLPNHLVLSKFRIFISAELVENSHIEIQENNYNVRKGKHLIIQEIPMALCPDNIKPQQLQVNPTKF